MIEQMENYDSIFTPEQLNYITKTVAKKAKELLGDKLTEVILYGSYARGDYHDWSDIDIMILADVDDMQAKKLDADITKKLGDLIYDTNLLLSPMLLSASTFKQYKEALPFYTNVDKEGVRIYA